MKHKLFVHKQHKLFFLFWCILLSSLLLSGCGKKKDAALETFQAQLDNFTNAVMKLDTDINSINPTSDNAVTQLLSYYDELNIQFAALAAIPVPDEYSDVARLSQKASEYMSQAVAYYHTAFESEFLDQDILDLASSYQKKAFDFVNYIGQVLMGADITFQSDLQASPED